MAHDVKYYTINKGKLLMQVVGGSGWEDLGNATKLEIAEELETLEHFSSRAGLKNRDQLIVTSLKATGSFTLDEITVENLRKYFLGGAETTTAQTSAVGETKTYLAADKITPDRWFEIGAINITVTQVDDNAGVPVVYTEGVDYELDLAAGLIFIKSGGAIVADQELKVTYDKADATIREFLGGEVTDIKAKLKFVAEPAIGEIQDIEGYGTLTPEGNYAAISEEYVTVDMKLEFLTHADYSPGLFKVTNRGNASD